VKLLLCNSSNNEKVIMVYSLKCA